jgi:site-specific DNA-cytosine methylase
MGIVSKNILEVFAGSRSIGNKAEELNMNVFSVDWTPYDKINLVIDVENLQINDIPFVPDLAWFSPDCTTYSIAAISTHRNGTEPKSQYAKKCDRVNEHYLKLIKKWLEINPKMVFFIENPRGMMRKMPFMKGLQRVTIWYCTYGDTRAKPTDIWSNNIKSIFNPNGWNPRAECFNGNKKCHHESAPRGSISGTQAKKGSYNRSKIPEQLCEEVLKSIL